jgi:hypothetical protein
MGPILKPMQADGGGGTGNGDEANKHLISHRELLHARKNTEVLMQPNLHIKKRKVDHKQYLTKNLKQNLKRNEQTGSRVNLLTESQINAKQIDPFGTISSTVSLDEPRRQFLNDDLQKVSIQVQSF